MLRPISYITKLIQRFDKGERLLLPSEIEAIVPHPETLIPILCEQGLVSQPHAGGLFAITPKILKLVTSKIEGGIIRHDLCRFIPNKGVDITASRETILRKLTEEVEKQELIINEFSLSSDGNYRLTFFPLQFNRKTNRLNFPFPQHFEEPQKTLLALEAENEFQWEKVAFYDQLTPQPDLHSLEGIIKLVKELRKIYPEIGSVKHLLLAENDAAYYFEHIGKTRISFMRSDVDIESSFHGIASLYNKEFFGKIISIVFTRTTLIAAASLAPITVSAEELTLDKDQAEEIETSYLPASATLPLALVARPTNPITPIKINEITQKQLSGDFIYSIDKKGELRFFKSIKKMDSTRNIENIFSNKIISGGWLKIQEGKVEEITFSLLNQMHPTTSSVLNEIIKPFFKEYGINPSQILAHPLISNASKGFHVLSKAIALFTVAETLGFSSNFYSLSPSTAIITGFACAYTPLLALGVGLSLADSFGHALIRGSESTPSLKVEKKPDQLSMTMDWMTEEERAQAANFLGEMITGITEPIISTAQWLKEQGDALIHALSSMPSIWNRHLASLKEELETLFHHPKTEPPLRRLISRKKPYSSQFDFLQEANYCFRELLLEINQSTDFSSTSLQGFFHYFNRLYKETASWQLLSFIPNPTAHSLKHASQRLSDLLSSNLPEETHLEILKQARQVDITSKLLLSYGSRASDEIRQKLQKKLELQTRIHRAAEDLEKEVIKRCRALAYLGKTSNHITTFADSIRLNSKPPTPQDNTDNDFTRDWRRLGEEPSQFFFRMLQKIDSLSVLTLPILGFWDVLNYPEILNNFSRRIFNIIQSDFSENSISHEANQLTANLLGTYLGNLLEPIECCRFGPTSHFFGSSLDCIQAELNQALSKEHLLQPHEYHYGIFFTEPGGEMSIPKIQDNSSAFLLTNFIAENERHHPISLHRFLKIYHDIVHDFRKKDSAHPVEEQNRFYQYAANTFTDVLRRYGMQLWGDRSGQLLFERLTQVGYRLRFEDPQQIDTLLLAPPCWKQSHLVTSNTLDTHSSSSSLAPNLYLNTKLRQNEEPAILLSCHLSNQHPTIRVKITDTPFSVTASHKTIMLNLQFGHTSASGAAHRYDPSQPSKPIGPNPDTDVTAACSAAGAGIGSQIAGPVGAALGALVGATIGSLFVRKSHPRICPPPCIDTSAIQYPLPSTQAKP